MSRTTRRTAFALAALACGVAVPPPSGTLTSGRLAIEISPSVTLSIGAIRLDGLVSAALAQTPATITLENVALSAGPLRYNAPRILFEGASLGQAELAALFDKNAPEAFAPRLARLSAKRITIPELVANQEFAGQKQETRYRNIVATDVVNGRIATLASESATVSGTTPQGDSKGSVGRMTVTAFDLAEMARVFAGTGGAEPPKEMRQIYGRYTLDGMTLTQAGEVEMRFGQIRGDGFSARPAKKPFTELMGEFPIPGAADKQTPAEQLKPLLGMAEIFDAVSFGTAEVMDTTIQVLKNEKAEVKIARIAFQGEGPGRSAETRLEGLTVGVPKGGHFKLASLVFSGYSFASTIAELKTLPGKDLDNLGADTIRRMIPTLGTFRLGGLDLDFTPPPDDPTDKPQPVRLTIKGSEITADKPLNGVPTQLRIAIDSLALAIDDKAEAEGLKQLASMGYKTLDLSLSLVSAWNEATSEIEVRQLALRGVDMGAATLRGTVGNVTRDAFDADTAVAVVALIGATYKNLDLTIENGGLFQRLVAAEARKKGKSPDAIRVELGAAAAIAIPAMLGNSPKAKALGQTVARFAAKPGRLRLSVKTKEPDGLGIADLATLQEPAQILEQLEITSTAE